MNQILHSNPTVRALQKAWKVSRDTFPALVASLAADGDVDVLQSVIDSGLLPSEYSPMSSRLFAAILSLPSSGVDPATATALTNAWVKALDIKTDPASLAYHLRFVESPNDAAGLMALGGDPTYATGKDQVKTTPLLAQISRRAQEMVDVMLAAIHERGTIPICSYTEAKDGTRQNVRTAFHHFAERIGSQDGDIEEFVLEQMGARGVSLSWQKEVGHAITKIFLDGQLSRSRRMGNWAFFHMLTLARFESQDMWYEMLSGKLGCMRNLVDSTRGTAIALSILSQAGADRINPDRILVPCRYEDNSYELPVLVAATMRNNADLAKRCIELGANPHQRLPASGDASEGSYSGKPLLDYALDIGSSAVASVLASWNAKNAVMSVASKAKTP